MACSMESSACQLSSFLAVSALVYEPAESPNVFDPPVAHQIGDAFDERRLVDLVRQFGNDDDYR